MYDEVIKNIEAQNNRMKAVLYKKLKELKEDVNSTMYCR